ncbi:hypothetical protein EW026_g1883 [Hermanssonia centrifuga]|uniref:Calcineurin-like phosphoesterase domain-containing protein n=1 Tax=Hermanssonia centrifuga TaxID=98765 RepID=A0A4S4KRT1_9APHY|nr:hypothetical protein EW026_g1883 [Hermanssonia centrifuga]
MRATSMVALKLYLSLGYLAFATARNVQSELGPSAFTAPYAFPTSAYKHYYNSPTAASEQPQPIISDPVSHVTYPLALTDPNSIPRNNTKDPHPLPPKASESLLLTQAIAQVLSISTNPVFGTDTCTRCQAALEVGKFLAMAAPEQGPAFAVAICDHFNFNSDCPTMFGLLGLGSVVTQVVANADVGGLDGQPLPSPPRFSSQLNWLVCKAKAQPASGIEEANDAPYSLILSALQAIPVLTGTQHTGFDFTVYTGDLVSHDPDNQLSRDYIMYAEVKTVLYDLFKRLLGSGPVYAALGNHDSYNQAQDAPHSLGGALADQFSWNYDHVAALWQHEQWISEEAVQLARAHYAAYMVKRTDGLRVITLNTDMWYRANYFNYINMSHPDTSGMLRFLTDELQEAEDAGDRVWIVGHVLSGWDGTNAMFTKLDRFSPHVIAAIFWGHTHEDQLSIFYANNATDISAKTAQVVSWIGPSVTPLTNLNSGFRMYEVDSSTFEIVDAHT